MRKCAIIVLLLLAIPTYVVTVVHASSSTAYQDYTFQFDQYRQKLSDFQVAYTQYKQFNSLTSLQDSLDKAKALFAQRNQVAKTYFLFLNEKLNEDPGLGTQESQTYRTTITNQVGFLDQNTAQSSAIQSIADAAIIETSYTKNYNAMQLSYRQTILGLELGYLQYFGGQYDIAAGQAQALIASNRGNSTPEKQATLDRWLTSLSNQHSLFSQKVVLIRTAMAKLAGDVAEQDRQFAAIQKTITAAKQDLVEGTSYLGEVQTALQYD